MRLWFSICLGCDLWLLQAGGRRQRVGVGWICPEQLRQWERALREQGSRLNNIDEDNVDIGYIWMYMAELRGKKDPTLVNENKTSCIVWLKGKYSANWNIRYDTHCFYYLINNNILLNNSILSLSKSNFKNLSGSSKDYGHTLRRVFPVLITKPVSVFPILIENWPKACRKNL